MVIDDEEALTEYLDTMRHAADVRQELRALIQDYRKAVPFLQPGRIVRLMSHIDGD